MFGCIIVATDLRSSTRASLAVACDLLHSEGQILLVHVMRPVPGLSDAEQAPVRERLRIEAGRQMRELAAGFIRERRVEILCLIETGSPGRQIAAIAAARQAELIVLAHDPVDDPATLGSVSFQVAHLAPCSVLVLKTPARPRALDASAPISGGPAPTRARGARGTRRSAR